MQIEYEPKLDFSDVLIKPKRSSLESRKDVDLTRTFQFRCGQQFTGIPLISANMTSVTTVDVARAMSDMKMLACLPKEIDLKRVQHLIGYSAFDIHNLIFTVGLNYDELEQFDKRLVEPYMLCVDVANGYTERFVEHVKKVRARFPDTIIIAGNVCTPEMTEQLILSGADIVKVGIGPGSLCLTRVKTGVGYPQLSAVIECADAAHGLNGHVISDGGCTSPGDVAKAFGAGADFVMLGTMLAGHNENRLDDGIAYGESSSKAHGRINKADDFAGTSEGRVVKLPNRGKLGPTLQDILGGLRSTCTYVGAGRLKDLSKCTTFVRVNHTHSDFLKDFTIGE